jgi:hypothetical protein
MQPFTVEINRHGLAHDMRRLGVDPATAAGTDRLLGRLADALTLARLSAPRGIFTGPELAELDELAEALYLHVVNAVDARLADGLAPPVVD